MRLQLLAAILSVAIFIGNADGADKVRIGVSNYNISNLTVGVAQTRGFFKQEGIDAEIIQRKDHTSCPGQARHEIFGAGAFAPSRVTRRSGMASPPNFLSHD